MNSFLAILFLYHQGKNTVKHTVLLWTFRQDDILDDVTKSSEK